MARFLAICVSALRTFSQIARKRTIARKHELPKATARHFLLMYMYLLAPNTDNCYGKVCPSVEQDEIDIHIDKWKVYLKMNWLDAWAVCFLKEKHPNLRFLQRN
jgi:hypothetical protein